MLSIPIFQLPHSLGLPLPVKGTAHAAGLDLQAALPDNENWILEPGERKLIPTGLKVAIPPGYEGQIRPRSGLALKFGVTVLNAPGTIDADYRGELQVLLVNHGSEPFCIRRGDRVAQLLLSPVWELCWKSVESERALGTTSRGEGGYGSTGIGAG